MFTNYCLFYDPESNRLFIPNYDTDLVDPDANDNTGFDVLTYKPVSSLEEYGLPRFRAVRICSFGTWGLIGATRDGIVKQFSEEKPYKSEALNDAFSEFRARFPGFANVKFAEENELKHVPSPYEDDDPEDTGVPESAVINI